MSWSVNCSAKPAAAHPHHPIPDKLPVCERHLREFCSSTSSPSSPFSHDFHEHSQQRNEPLVERVPVKPMVYINYLLNGLSLCIRNLRHPSTIPGRSLGSKLFALGLFPMLAGILIFCQWIVTMVVVLSSYTSLGRKAFQLFMSDQIILFDPTGMFWWQWVHPCGNWNAKNAPCGNRR